MKRCGKDAASRALLAEESSPRGAWSQITTPAGTRQCSEISSSTATTTTSLRNALRMIESSPVFPTEQPSLEFERAMSEPSPLSTRRADIQVEPESLAKLHELNTSLLASRYPSDQAQDISRQHLSDSWGTAGSWHLWGQTTSTMEAPLGERKFAFSPANQGESAQGMLRRYGAIALNTKGMKEDNTLSPGQDNLSISRLPSGWEVFCVFDGHGLGGHWPAERAAQTLPYFLQSRVCTAHLKSGKPRVGDALTHAFRKVQADLVYHADKERISLLCAGCTAVCAMKKCSSTFISPAAAASSARPVETGNQLATAESLWLAVCGDSRAALIVPGKGVVRQTHDHKPDRPEERSRVEKSGGEVISKIHQDGFVEERVYIRGQRYPGLQMTRSLGDLLVKSHGVVAEPEIYEWPLEGYRDPLLIVATDGVWELVDTAEVADLVLKAIDMGRSLDEASKELLELSRTRWFQAEETYCDDISLVLVPLHTAAPVGNWDAPPPIRPRRSIGQVLCRCLRRLFGRRSA
eukprot:TRINITY_DN10903_c0_g1_i1.p1 TRINITY_DN10903_c0_g1~~TRINITY_DN10903_c0_g1_i1.p1  ORF type:complete len:521 (+),score=85.45 TRINITY_DN10903_c0_g1_i1:190-1752(+)